MNSAIKTPHFSEICEGCLTTDRRLSLLYQGEIKELYTQLLKAGVTVNAPVTLCWECVAALNSITQFKNQIRKAHYELYRLMINESLNLESLSKLKVHTNKQITFFEYQEQNTDDTSVPLDESCQNTKLDGVRSSLEEERKTKKTQPLAFIKIEGGNDFIDDDFVQCDDSDLKAVLKSEQSQEHVAANYVNSVIKDSKDFDESDDEPLVLKKRGGGEKKRKGRRKKEETGTKTRAKRREKPPGVVSNPRVDKKLKELNIDSGLIEMVVLSWEEVELERQMALQSETFTRHEHRCRDCALGFNHRVKLDNHMKKHDQSLGGCACAVCRVVCRDAPALSAHLRRHRVRWRCTLCGARWSRACVAADHCARAHAARVTHTCATCGRTEPTLSKLRIHQRSHSARRECGICHKTLRDNTALRTHMFIHRGEKEHKCPRCDKRFLFKKSMEIHLVTHETHANLYCHQCDMNFKNKMSYYQHMKYNLKHIDPAKLKYVCNLCPARFFKAARLAEHRSALHDKVTPIACAEPGCSFTCASRGVLRSHMRAAHRRLVRARNHVCHTCGKTYTTKKSLEGHLRSHTGERPFSCTLCSSTFGYEAALYNHNKLVHLKAKVNKKSVPPAPLAPPVPPAHTLNQAWQIHLQVLPETDNKHDCN